MKLIICILSIFSVTQIASARTRNSPELGLCKQLAAEAATNRLLEGFNLLPLSWDDFYSVRYVNEGKMEGDLVMMRRTNDLALVPEAPVIRAESGVRRQFVGWGVLAISRHEKFHEEYNATGRFTILVGPNRKDTDNLRFESYFLPAEVSRAILDQIPDFDPTLAPLAFENVEQLALDEKKRDKKTIEFLKQKSHEARIRAVKDFLHPGDKSSTTEPDEKLWLWLAMPVFALIAWLVTALIRTKRRE